MDHWKIWDQSSHESFAYPIFYISDLNGLQLTFKLDLYTHILYISLNFQIRLKWQVYFSISKANRKKSVKSQTLVLRKLKSLKLACLEVLSYCSIYNPFLHEKKNCGKSCFPQTDDRRKIAWFKAKSKYGAFQA